jgi:hypothetical protein
MKLFGVFSISSTQIEDTAKIINRIIGRKMIWQFIDTNTLQEMETGYSIYLVSGTWFHPQKIKPISPPDIPFPKQIKLLRSGLSHIKSIGHNKQAS